MIRSSRSFLARFSRYSAPETVEFKEASQSGLERRFSTWRSSGKGEDELPSRRTFANFSIFKGKAALTVQPVLPNFTTADSGVSILKKGGRVMLTFMPAVGARKYDYERKQLFSLSPTEVGCLISLGAGESCEFFHDPFMKSSNEGQVRKSLSVNPASTDGSYFFSLNVSNSSQNSVERFSVPVTKAEFSVLRTSFSFILPHIMGWGRIVADELQPSQPGATGKVAPILPSHELEWNR